jgi:hypothetical protein
VRSNGGAIVQKGNSTATGAIAYEASGKISSEGMIQSGSDIQLQSSDFTSNGNILSNGAIWLYATGNAENSGTMDGDKGVSALSPVPFNSSWQREVAKTMGIVPKNMLDCFFDVDGEPLIMRLRRFPAFSLLKRINAFNHLIMKPFTTLITAS